MYNKIITYIRAGYVPVVQDKNGNYRACIFEKDGLIFATSSDNIDKIYNGNGCTWDKEDIEEYEWKIVRLDKRTTHQYKVGDKVNLDIEALKLTDNWEDYKDNYKETTGLEIKEIDNSIELTIQVRNKDKDNYKVFRFSPQYLIPHFEEEQPKLTDEELIAELTKRGMIKEGKILV